MTGEETDPRSPAAPSPFRGEAHVLDVVGKLRREARESPSLDEAIQAEFDRLRERRST